MKWFLLRIFFLFIYLFIFVQFDDIFVNPDYKLNKGDRLNKKIPNRFSREALRNTIFK